MVRLGRLADSGRTGALRLTGDFGGAIYLSEGDVVYAESKRTPGLARGPLRPPAVLDEGETAEVSRSGAAPPWMNRGGGAALAANPDPAALRPLEWSFAVREATFDALLELLLSRSSWPRFRAFATPEISATDGISQAALIAEVNRRKEIMKQLSALVTADTAVARNPHFAPPSLQVSALQWALLIRVSERSTPRSLAWDLGHSVFGTTIEVFRLVVLGFLSVVDVPHPPAAAPDERPRPLRNTVSFLRAVDPVIKAPAPRAARDLLGTGNGGNR